MVHLHCGVHRHLQRVAKLEVVLHPYIAEDTAALKPFLRRLTVPTVNSRGRSELDLGGSKVDVGARLYTHHAACFDI